MIKDIQIEDRFIGENHKALLIAEMSANHDRDLNQAFELVDLAAECGWDCVKLQTYDADSLTVPSQHHSMKIDPVWGKDYLYDLYQTACMPMEFHKPLFERIREKGLMPFTSVYDPRDIDFIEKLDCPIYKIASFEITFDDLLAEVAQTGKPVILSTGMATLDEVEHALEILDSHTSGPVVLLHCSSCYPAPVESANLSAMIAMKNKFERHVGFSDHTIGSVVSISACALGAAAIEKHYTNDCSRKGPDHRFSATEEVMKTISDAAAQIQLARGDGVKKPHPDELQNMFGRRSAFALSALPAGHILSENDFRFVRPGVGVPANQKHALLGKSLIRDVAALTPITYDDIE